MLNGVGICKKSGGLRVWMAVYMLVLCATWGWRYGFKLRGQKGPLRLESGEEN